MDKDKAVKDINALWWQLRIWQVCGWCVSFVPLLCVLVARREAYFVGYTGLRVGCGVVVALVVSLFVALRKAKFPGRVLTLWLAVGMVWLIIPLLEDMLLLLFLLAVGVTLDELVCQSRVKTLRRRVEREEHMEDLSGAIQSALTANNHAQRGGAEHADE